MLRLRHPLVLLLLPITLTILLLHFASSPPPSSPTPQPVPCGAALSDATDGRWVPTPSPAPPPLYSASCPFHRNAWNCLRNGRPQLAALSWAPTRCGGAVVPRIDAAGFLAAARGRRIGLVGDSLSENLVVALLCALRSSDDGARKWKRRGAWRGGYFPREDVVVAYHRAVLLAKYTSIRGGSILTLMYYLAAIAIVGYKHATEESSEKSATIIKTIKMVAACGEVQRTSEGWSKGYYRVDIDIPADDWVNVTKFYDVLIFNTGHWKTLKLWRTQSPRHFYGDYAFQKSYSLFENPVQLNHWFDPMFGGVNKEARMVNSEIKEAIAGTDIQLLNLTYMSEFRADAHPAIWLGKKDAVAVYGQDCMHWCLPGVPDTWVDILAAQILHYLKKGKG
ncbi:hypothetical protein HU200_001194 [Digitaria exilis]|uniref:Trichome birefringence-like N-terminal domain-containing protein n=1 Tax=Digitaria exilis TaxID=1010633 RepID=A0A835KXT7_9POAL|nr:hypothetical protein HU200_001194 [Digitaria exilis]